MPITDYQHAAQTIADFLGSLNQLGGLRLKYRITAGEGARDPDGLEAREIYVELAGPDAHMLTAHNGELLRALEAVAAQMLRLDPREHDLVSFDSGNFKALRASELRLSAETAAEQVRHSGLPFSFQPMNSRERRLLHMVFKEMDDLETASNGEGRDRHLVVYRKGEAPPEQPRTFAPRDDRGRDRGGDRGRDRGRSGGFGRR
jgi:spoIIIJ-associated protein